MALVKLLTRWAHLGFNKAFAGCQRRLDDIIGDEKKERKKDSASDTNLRLLKKQSRNPT